MANREQLAQALRKGETVTVRGQIVTDLNDLPQESKDGPRVTGYVSRDREGRLTREGMEAAIAEGGSVRLPGGSLATRLEDLPTPADLATGDEERIAAERQRLLAQKEAVDRELAKLDRPKAEATPPAAQAAAPPAAEGDFDEPDDLSNLNVPELRQHARDRDIDLHGATTKADILAAIRAAK